MSKVYANATPAQKEKLVADYLPLVNKIARGLARRSTDPVDDLIQVGSIGLLEAINRYEAGHNTSFKTYAIHFITGHIRHYLRDRQALVRGPRALQELSYRLRTMTQDLNHQLGREATAHELAEALAVTTAQIDEARVYARRVSVIWLDQETEGDEDEQRSLINTLADPSTAHADDRDERLMLAEAIRALPENLSELIRLRYLEDLTQAELSRRFCISQMEVSRRLRKAEKQIRLMVSALA
ncbi:MAG: sigma-70 family RNA polymerase sigma factor [Polaromonas sp.]|nr:sigma-70 family RNA polymerase sigma factor [Gemmatimonadaceae bacterium]